MAFSKKVKSEVEDYCNNHLAKDCWYENEFSFIKDKSLKKSIIEEFKAIRFAYKLYEGIGATKENLRFEVRNQILAYASIYEVVIDYVLKNYYLETKEYDDLTHYHALKRISIPQTKQSTLQKELSHDGKKIIPTYYGRKKKSDCQITFEAKCKTAKKLGLIHNFTSKEGEEIDFAKELIEIYKHRNGIHIMAEKKNGIKYESELELSKKAYRRMQPFIKQIKDKLLEDKKI